METSDEIEPRNCAINLRSNPQRRRDTVYIGCGAGFRGDRPSAALKLLRSVKELNYLVLECLAERTLAERYRAMMAGGDGFDPRIQDWMRLLLPLAVERGTCIITNMGAMDPPGAQGKVLEVGSNLGLSITVAVAHETAVTKSGVESLLKRSCVLEGGISTYLGAAPIVESLEKYKPNVIITSRVADASLFLAPMVYELGWNWDDFNLLAQGSLAAHLLECGCQLTGGYFMHPGDKQRDISFPQLLDLSLPFAEVCFDGQLCVAKANNSGGILNYSTCAEQLLYEVGDPSAYVTPDVVIDVTRVQFRSLSSDKVLCTGAKPSSVSLPEKLLQLVPKDCGWKGWGEISYGGHEAIKRAKASEFLVRSWMEEVLPASSDRIISYIIGVDSLRVTSIEDNVPMKSCEDIRLRMDGLFERKEHAEQFVQEFTALYTNGPAGGGGISTGHNREVVLEKHMVHRDSIFWRSAANHTMSVVINNKEIHPRENPPRTEVFGGSFSPPTNHECTDSISAAIGIHPAPYGKKIPLYDVGHSRAGDKGNDMNFSIIPHFPPDIERLKLIITPEWVKSVVSSLLNPSTFPAPDAVEKRDLRVREHVKVEIYEVKGIHSLNVVVRNILDGGVNCSRRIDRHGKTISDLILCQEVVLPP